MNAARPPEGVRTAAREGEGIPAGARANILAKLRAAAPATGPALPDVSGWYTAHRRDENPAQRVARLRAAMEGVKTEVHDTTPADWPQLLLQLAAAKGLRNLLIGNGTPHGARLEAMHPQNLQLRRYDQPAAAWRNALFDEVDASLTLARSAIAEIGSLILWPTPQEPRLMSLVPPVHFVLLDPAKIHADFHAAMTAEAWMDGLPTNALLISGPSKTADIQQTLAYGAHGPRELVLLLCHAEGAVK
jgi:L-lactate dehydrogenase complex protein LldG